MAFGLELLTIPRLRLFNRWTLLLLLEFKFLVPIGNLNFLEAFFK